MLIQIIRAIVLIVRAARWTIIPIVIGIICLSGCSIFRPKDKEFFQKKVTPVPERVTPEYQETQRQGLAYVRTNVTQAYVMAVQEQSSTNIINPLEDAIQVIDPLVVQAGPPEHPFKGEPQKLAKWINENTAKYNKAIDRYTDKIEPLVGKKIEGTGWIQMGYFTYIGLVLFGFFILYTVVRMLINVLFPEINVGVKAISNMSSKAVAAAFSQLVNGGEYFKKLVDEKIDDQATIDHVKELFRIAHETKQSPQVQETVKHLTS